MKRIAFRLWLSLAGIILFSALWVSLIDPLGSVSSVYDAKKKFDQLSSISEATFGEAQNTAPDTNREIQGAVMATLEEIATALKNADAAGDVEAARKLAQAYRYNRSVQRLYGIAPSSFIAAGIFIFFSALSFWGGWLVGATHNVLKYYWHFWFGLSVSLWPPAIVWGSAAFVLPYSVSTQAAVLTLALLPFVATAYIVRRAMGRGAL